MIPDIVVAINNPKLYSHYRETTPNRASSMNRVGSLPADESFFYLS